MSAISEQYAVALFELSNQTNNLDAITAEFKQFIASIDLDTMGFFKHPGVEKKRKKDVVHSLDQSELFNHFLCVLIDNNRFDIIHDIKASFDVMLDNMFKRMTVYVYSKKPLTKAKVSALKTEYENKYNRQVTIENRVDESILGGLRFEFDGKVIDDTINNNLHQLKRRLTR